jgi:hypothetical protein
MRVILEVDIWRMLLLWLLLVSLPLALLLSITLQYEWCRHGVSPSLEIWLVEVEYPCSPDQLNGYHTVLVLATGPGSDWKDFSIPFQNRPRPRSTASRWATPGPVPINPRVLSVWLDLSVQISSSVFRVFLCMVAFKYPTVNRKILTFAHHWPFQKNRPPL